MRLWTNTLLRLASGTYFVLTSIYCLLAFLPYTFYFLIKSPPYAWMPWFVQHQAALYWVAAAAAVLTQWSDRQESFSRSHWRSELSVAALISFGIYVTFHPFLKLLDSSRTSYAWSLAALLPLAAISIWQLSSFNKKLNPSANERKAELFPYPAALIVAGVVSAIYVVSARMRIYHETRTFSFHAPEVQTVIWSMISHAMLVIAAFSVINLVTILAAKTGKPRSVRLVMNAALIFACLWTVLYRFLASALSFSGFPAHFYAASLALALTLWGLSLVLPITELSRASTSRTTAVVATWAVLAAACAFAIAFPFLIGDADWSGFLQSIVTFSLWIAVSLCVFRLRPSRARYSALTVLGVLAVCALTYKGLQATEIFWSRPLGATDDEISLALQEYGGHDNSFQLVNQILGNSRHEVCGDLCRILRENTNIRDTEARSEVRLVDPLTATKSARPNIFVFVIDSMRPDYLGAYNPQVDYTPNLDAFARDSVVLHKAYSQYAGTSLSEPAIWAGAMMLHAHYLQPFSKLNSLDRLAHTDAYEEIVSVDEVLSAILPPDDGIVKLDSDKKLWNQLEIGSTVRQAEAVIDARKDSQPPIFFYAQPKNVHQFARNDVPSPVSQHWPDRPGLNTRITYEVHWVDSCLGQFFDYLKRRGLYESSIIIVTSDHGDATGEFGRMSHSTSIWPEIMHVPLIIHLPAEMRKKLVYDDSRLSTLTDITPTLYYLLGHHPVQHNALYGRPLFAETKQELDSYAPRDLLLASDVRAVYGILTADGRYLYTTYDSPAQSYLFDLTADPNAQHSILTPALKQRYDEELIEQLQTVGSFYRYKPGVSSLLAATAH